MNTLDSVYLYTWFPVLKGTNVPSDFPNAWAVQVCKNIEEAHETLQKLKKCFGITHWAVSCVLSNNGKTLLPWGVPPTNRIHKVWVNG